MRKKLIAGLLGVCMVFSYGCKKSEQKATKQCLRMNLKEEPSSLDPRRGRNLTGASHLHVMLFEGLMKLESNGSLSCAQAESYEISSDKKTYTFHLGHHFWSDKTPVTAYDFENTWKDLLDPSFPALDAQALYSVKNAMAAKRGEMPLDRVGIYARDDKTLVVELEHPTPHFLQITASSVLLPINKTQDRYHPNWYAEASQHFVSNGPFLLKEWKHHNHIVLEKNPHYRRADQVQLESIYISMIDNETAALHLYQAGNLDVLGLPTSPLPFDAYPSLMQKNMLKLFQAPGTMACMFNTKQFPFYNANMRRAFSYAIDRKILVDNVTQLQEDLAFGVVPPKLKKGSAAFAVDEDNTSQARAYFQKGLEELGIQAKDLNGKISFCYWIHDHACPMLPQALQQQWLEKLGVEVELEALEFKTLHERGKKGLFSMGYFVFISMYHDPIELLDRFKYAENARNYSRWQNAAYVQLLDQGGKETSDEKHFQLLDQAEQVLIDEMPFAPVFHWNYALLVQPYVKGFEVSPLGFLYLDRVSIEKN